MLREGAANPAGGRAGGKRRLAFADEPMEGLAPLVARGVEDVVRRIKDEGNTILLVEQNAEVAMSLSDRGYILNHGSVMAHGTIAHLREDTEAMHRYLAV
jgi:branched-chain amino acid transport system ATP-binding protein